MPQESANQKQSSYCDLTEAGMFAQYCKESAY